MADVDIPADLIQMRRDFVRADAARAGEGEEAQRAYREAQRLAEAIQDHPWWAECDGNRFDARMALIAAAKQPETPSP